MTFLHRLFLFLLLAIAIGARAEELTEIQITPGPFIFESVTNTWKSTVSIKNVGATAITGNIKLVRGVLSPGNATIYRSDGYETNGNEYVDVPLPEGWLSPNATVLHSIQVISSSAITVATFKAVGRRLQGAPATIQVNAYNASGPDGTTKGMAVGAGYSVAVDGMLRGFTDSTGKLSLPIDPRSSQLRVYRAPNLSGSVDLPEAANGQTIAVDILIDDGAEIYADSKLFIRQVRNKILPISQSVLNVVFMAGAAELKVRKVHAAFIQVDGRTVSVTSALSVVQGEITASLAAIQQALGSTTGLISLDIDAKGADGSNLRATTKFWLGKNEVKIRLIAPPSRADLAVSNLPVQVRIGDSNITLRLITNQTGEVIASALPDGLISITAGTVLHDVNYRADAVLNINANIHITAVLRSSIDADSFVVPFTTVPSRSGSAQKLSSQFVRRVSLSDSTNLPSSLNSGLSTGGGSNPAVQTSNSSTMAQFSLPSWFPNQNEAYSRFQLAQGTSIVTYVYHLNSGGTCGPNPGWPPSSDEWTVSIDAGGTKIFEKSGDIKSYCAYIESGGIPITGTIDVSALTATSPVWITIRGRLFDSVVVDETSGLSGRHLMTAKVAAAVGKIVITSVSADKINARNDGTYYSLPRTSNTNVLQRTFTLNVSKTAGVSLLTAKVNILTPRGTSLFQSLNASPGQPGFEVLEETLTTAVLRLRGTVLDPPSTIDGAPPPMGKFTYLFSLSGKLGTTSVSGSYRLTERNALWIGPDAVISKTYGSREAGGDKWTSRETFSWLTTNASLLKELGDISGEHGKDIGHRTHATGNDIDMFHFYRFPGVTTGPGGATLNYNKLAEDTTAALGTLVVAPALPQASALASKQRVIEWINASRTGLTALAQSVPVQMLYYCDGEAIGTTLPNGWCRSLLMHGKLTYVNGSEVVFVSTAYTNAKLQNNDVHNNHVHITIDRAKVIVQN